VREYLAGLEWDGTPRLTSWLSTYLNASGDARYLSTVGKKFLVSAVARIEKPGCQVDHTLVLEGDQGIGKSSAVRLLAKRPEWFTDSMPDMSSKDAALQLHGHWFIELAELASFRRTAELEAVKAFLTRPVDHFRPPYARRTVGVPRQSVFVGTTNETLYFRDPSGNRRFWPVRCGQIDLKRLAEDVDQLWAEALEAYELADQWHLTAEEAALATAEQNDRVLITELESQVAEYLESVSRGEVAVREVLIHALHLDPDQPDFVERSARLGVQVAHAMNAAGWRKVRTVGRGKDRRTIYRKSL